MVKAGVEHYTVENIYKGPPNQRVLTDMCIIVMKSHGHREDALKHIEKDIASFKGPGPNELKFDRAKTLLQLGRNNALRKVADLLKKEVSDAASVEIVWKMDGTKNREVHVAKQPAFRQTIDDQKGVFLDRFSSLEV